MKEWGTAHTVANEVRMMRTQHKGALVIVEGPSDKTAFRALLDPQACRFVIAYGREKATAALQILDLEAFSGVLAVVDADFAHLEDAPSASDNILITDLHDLECMMIASPAFAKLLNEYAVSSRLEAFEARYRCTLAAALARNAMPIGYLRWLSLRDELGLDFDGLSFRSFVDRTQLDVDLRHLITAVKNRSQRHDLDDSQILSDVESLRDPNHDPWQVSCGHDMVEMLSFALQRTIAARRQAEVKPDVLQRNLRLAYEASYLKETSLYDSIKTWESAHPPYTVLRD